MVSFEPRTRFSAAVFAPANSLPPERRLPPTSATPASNPMAARNNWVFPDPDSPTTPTHSWGSMRSDAPATASSVPLRCPKRIFRSSTLKVATTSRFLDVERVAQTIAKDVQTKQQYRQEAARHQQHPG